MSNAGAAPYKPLTIYENPNVDMVKAIAAAAAAANALGDVTEDPDKKQHYENLSNPDKNKALANETAGDEGGQVAAIVVGTAEDVDLPTVSMLFMFLYFFKPFLSCYFFGVFLAFASKFALFISFCITS